MKQCFNILLGTLLILGFVVTGLPVDAQIGPCDKRPDVVAHLKKEYKESPRSMGLASNGSVIEVFVSPKGSFTIIITQPTGISCLVAGGENWEDLPERIDKEPSY